MSRRPKVFGIGFHKTATTSLRDALRVLGYSVTGPDFSKADELDEGLEARALERAEEFDAVQDNPWPLFFRQLDARFPGSKFVLTKRDTDRWYASCLHHFGARETPRRRYIYGEGGGAPAGNEALYKARYDAHNREVMDYFADRPSDLLVMDITRGDGWEKLCPFLGEAIPDRPFPHKNPASARPLRKAWNTVRAKTKPLRKRLGLRRA